MKQAFWIFAALMALLTSPAHADSADVEAAARGVVRVVLIGTQGPEGEEAVIPVSHGSGFAVTPTLIVTNAHVIREALQDDTLRIGVVPSESVGEAGNGAFARAISVSPRNDLALLEIAEDGLRLPALTIAGVVSGDMGEVSAVGYPMNVDLAQGLDFADIFDAQPPVKTRGFLSGQRPSRQFDTLLHTAPIARGNSGGPLLDSCGRVVGVNSFGADSDGSDAEFYFAVSLRELLPFLRANDVEPNTSTAPCRSFAELNAAERARFEAERAEARERIAAREAKAREAREAARLQALLDITEARDNAVALALVLLLLALVCAAVAVRLRQAGSASGADGSAQAVPQPRVIIAAGLSGAFLIAMALVWITRPGFSELEDRVASIMGELETGEDETPAQPSLASEGTLLCTFIPERSRVTGARTDDVEFDWAADGCVNSRTQYGFANGDWTRVFVPNDESAVSINSYDPQTRIFRTDRYLLGRAAMKNARAIRDAYTPPACGVTDAARVLGEQQSAILSILPERPNERLVYICEAARGVPQEAE
ncbi:MAG: serine protease [Erythrobacter sp.]|uniref:S1 family peptidase n=1 Tax=Erythrobacter sp. TaxID=1042 RepID=UPI0026114709|nr:serine protease [Erythrobacter sp.]MDJ0978800.1 serine protease [Erythrobacter sp.]